MQGKSADEMVSELYSVAEPFLPQEYRALAKSFVGMMMNSSWPDAVDFFADIVKEYGRDGNGQSYRRTRAVLDGMIGAVTDYEPGKQQPDVPRA